MQTVQSAFGQLSTAGYLMQAGWKFDYNANPDIVTTSAANGGSATTSSGLLTLATGTTNNGTASVRSRGVLRYVTGIGARAMFTAIFATPAANSTQIIGVGNATDGFFFGYNGTSFGIMRRKASVDTWTPIGNWTHKNHFTTSQFSPQLGNVFQITYQWLGFGEITYWIEDPSVQLGRDGGAFQVVHKIRYANTATAPSVATPTFPLYAEVKNAGNTSNIQLKTASGSAGIDGALPSSDWFHPFTIVRTSSAGQTGITAERNVLAIKNNATFNSLANQVQIALKHLESYIEGVGTTSVKLRIHKNVPEAAGWTFTDFDATRSPVGTYKTNSTFTANTNPIVTIEAARNARIEETLLERFGQAVLLLPGDSIVVSALTTVATIDPEVSLTWAEYW